MKRIAQVIHHHSCVINRATCNGKYSLLLVLPLLLLVPQLSSRLVSAQTTTATIEGTTKDPRGSAVAGATITVKSTALGTERTVTSDDNGDYRISALPAGSYSLSVTAAGFATKNFQNLELTVNRTLKLDVSLDVGS